MLSPLSLLTILPGGYLVLQMKKKRCREVCDLLHVTQPAQGPWHQRPRLDCSDPGLTPSPAYMTAGPVGPKSHPRALFPKPGLLAGHSSVVVWGGRQPPLPRRLVCLRTWLQGSESRRELLQETPGAGRWCQSRGEGRVRVPCGCKTNRTASCHESIHHTDKCSVQLHLRLAPSREL